jgi:hypothetical protein
LNVAPSNPTAATGTSVAVSFDTSTGQFKLVSPVITRPGARVNQTKTSSDAVIHAATTAPAAPVYQVTAPKVLALNSFATLLATDASGNSVNVNIPITLYAPGEQSDLVAISLDQYGNMGTSASTAPALSRDGQVMSFVSSANNIGTFGNVSSPQIFRYATSLATVDLISQSSSISGTLSGVAAQSASVNPALSADGLTLAFASDAANLYPYSIFNQAKTRQLYTISGNAAISTTTPSPSPAVLVNGAPAAYAFDRPSLSLDGTKLAFDTTAPLAGTAGGVSQVYVKNMTSGVVTLAGSTSTGLAGNGAGLNASLSDDGRYVLFESDATNLALGASARQIYLKDLTTGTLTLVSSAKGVAGNAPSLNAKLSGQVTYSGAPGYAVFESDATNLVPTSNNGQRQVYRVNLSTGAVSLVSANASGLAVGGSNAAISGDGRFVVFKSAGAVIGTSAPTSAQIYVTDTFAGTTALVSADVNGLPGNGASDTPTLSADGRTIGFVSRATNLDGTATNGVTQTYIAANKLVPPLVTGFWVNPNAPGQYWGIEQSGNKLWVAGFGYYNDTTPGWVFAIEQGLTANAFQGSLLSTANGPTLAGIGGPAIIAGNLGATGLTVSGQTFGAQSWLSSTGTIQRQDIITGGSSAGPVAGYPEAGWWYAPQTNQSLFLEVQGTTLAANIASYATTGRAIWYQTTGTMTSAQAYSGQLNACTGGVTPTCATNAGTISLTFSSTLAGTMTLPGGKALAIQRFRF